VRHSVCCAAQHELLNTCISQQTERSPTMIAWGRMILSAMDSFNRDNDSSLVRMFRVEYANEYRHMEKMGCEINDSFVRQFLIDRKSA
jgi:hypothetical protein